MLCEFVAVKTESFVLVLFWLLQSVLFNDNVCKCVRVHNAICTSFTVAIEYTHTHTGKVISKYLNTNK